MMKYLLLVLTTLLAGYAAEPATRSTPRAATNAAAAKRTSSTPADAEIERAIKARFAKSKVSADNFQVRVNNGVATIEGTTSVIQRKGSATRMAKTAGALSVVNNIKISEAARQKAAQHLATVRRSAVKRKE